MLGKREIVVKEMYAPGEGKFAARKQRSVEIDPFIRLNNSRIGAMEPRKFPFKTSIEAGFLSLFAKENID